MCSLSRGTGRDVLSGRIISNFKQVELSKQDYEKVTAIGHGNKRRCATRGFFFPERRSGIRYNIPVTFKPKWNINTFDEEVEKGAGATVRIA